MRQPSAFVRSAALSNYAEAAALAGLDPGVMLRRAGVDPRALTDPDVRIPTGRVVTGRDDRLPSESVKGS